MKIQSILPLAFAAFVMQSHAEDKMVLKDQKDKAGYSIGTNIGSSLRQDGLDLNIDALVAGAERQLHRGRSAAHARGAAGRSHHLEKDHD